MTDYAAITSWLEFVRDCIRRPEVHRAMDPDNLVVEAGLSMLRGSLEGTPYGTRMSDAVLELIANGTIDEQRELLGTSLEGAPQMGSRVAAIARAWRGGPMDRSIGKLLLRGLEAAPDDPDVLAAYDDEARRGGGRTIDALVNVASHNAGWVADHVNLLTPDLDPDATNLGDLVRSVQVRVP